MILFLFKKLIFNKIKGFYSFCIYVAKIVSNAEVSIAFLLEFINNMTKCTILEMRCINLW